MENKIKVVGKIDLSIFTKKSKVEPVKEVKLHQEEIHFFSDKNKRVVGRVSSGKIAIISFDFKKHWIKSGETWLCNIISEEENKVIVMPVVMIKSADDNYAESIALVGKLKETGFAKEFTHPKNSRIYYISK